MTSSTHGTKRWIGFLSLLLIASILLAACGKANEPEAVQLEAASASDKEEAIEQGKADVEIEEELPVSADARTTGEDNADIVEVEEEDKIEAGNPDAVNSDSNVKPVAEQQKPEEKATENPGLGESDAKESQAVEPRPSPAPAESSSPPKAVEPEEPQENTVTLSIDGGAKHGMILERTEIKLEKNDTVLDILIRETRKHKIHMEFRGRGSLAYVEGIDNVYEFDEGPTSGWIYKINGEEVNKSAGSRELKKGDIIEWIYSVEEQK